MDGLLNMDYNIMRPTHCQFRSSRHPHQEQLCRLLLALPNRNLPQKKIQCEFDDHSVSQTPKSKLSNNVSGRTILQAALQDKDRRQRIKIKIKSQVREKIKQIASKQTISRKSIDSPISRCDKLRSTQTRSDVFAEKLLDGKAENIISKCIAKQITLRNKETMKQVKYRSRLISTSLRSYAADSLRSQSPQAKMSTPHLNLREQQRRRMVQVVGEEVEPWRYSEDMHEEANLQRN